MRIHPAPGTSAHRHATAGQGYRHSLAQPTAQINSKKFNKG